MVRINQVAPTIPLTRINATSERREYYGGLWELFSDLGESSYDNWNYQ